MHRIFNFSAGPAVLPLPVLEEAQRDLVALPGVGMSVMEISHRSKTFEDHPRRARSPTSASWPGSRRSYKVLLLQGGASLQFSMVPMNLLGAGADGRLHRHRLVGRQGGQGSEEGRHGQRRRLDEGRQLHPHSRAGRAQAHAGRRLRAHHDEQHDRGHRVEGRCRMSATRRSSPTPRRTSSAGRSTFGRFGLIYAGAQKNLGPSGVTLVIVREDLLARSPDSLPTMLNYKVQAENNSLYNTPPTFGIYILGLTMKWLKSLGGLAGDRRHQPAQGGEAVRRDRSHRLLSRHGAEGQPVADERHVPAAERGAGEAFDKEATAAGLDGLKGHRSVGGMRASIYNAFPEDGVDALVEFMREFERKRG